MKNTLAGDCSTYYIYAVEKHYISYSTETAMYIRSEDKDTWPTFREHSRWIQCSALMSCTPVTLLEELLEHFRGPISSPHLDPRRPKLSSWEEPHLKNLVLLPCPEFQHLILLMQVWIRWFVIQTWSLDKNRVLFTLEKRKFNVNKWSDLRKFSLLDDLNCHTAYYWSGCQNANYLLGMMEVKKQINLRKCHSFD